MGRLTNQQWETIYEGMLCVLRAETLEDFANESIGCIAALVPSKRYLLFTFTKYLPGDIQFGDVFTFGRPAARLDAFMHGPYLNEDWLFNRMSLKNTDCAYRDSDIIDEELLVKQQVYKDIYQKDGIHYGMRINMMVGNVLAGSYSIFRSKEEGDFSDAELDVCNRLAPLLSARFGELLKGQREPVPSLGMSRIDVMERYGLTMREYQVAKAIAQGCTDDEVADSLSVSSATVRKHLYNAYAKLGISKRSQLKELFRF